jgi:hypothetical protein
MAGSGGFRKPSGRYRIRAPNLIRKRCITFCADIDGYSTSKSVPEEGR